MSISPSKELALIQKTALLNTRRSVRPHLGTDACNRRAIAGFSPISPGSGSNAGELPENPAFLLKIIAPAISVCQFIFENI